MPETITLPKDEVERLRERARKLAMEKSYLQLAIDMIARLSSVSGIEDIIANLLRIVVEVIGGSNLIVYRVDGEIFAVDVYGNQQKLAAIDDPLVQKVFATRQPAEDAHPFAETGMATPEFTQATTCALPLLVGSELIGVLKMEGMLLSAEEILTRLDPFFKFAALALKNEISSYAKLHKAYDQLQETNVALSGEIEQRQRVEADLVREREFSHALLESMVDGVVACDAQGMLALFNRSAREWHGLDVMRLPPEEWPKHYDLFHDDGLTPLTPEEVPLARAFRGETVIDVGMAIMARGQGPRYILANGSAIRDAAGKKLGAVVVMRDMTGLRRVEAELRKVNETLEKTVAERTAQLARTLETLQSELAERKKIEQKLLLTQLSVDNSADCIFWVRPDGSFAGWNKAVTSMLGYADEELARLKTFDLNPEHQADAWRAHWDELRRQGSFRFETVLARKDGGQVPVEIMANHVEIEGQEYNCGVVRDITERRLAQLRLQLVLDSVDALVYVADMETNEVLFINRYGRERWGDAVGRVCWQVLQSGQTGPCPFCTNPQLILSGGEAAAPLVWEVRNTVNHRWYECRDQAIRWADGRLVRMQIATDITERKLSEQEREKAAAEWSAAIDASPDVIYLLDLERRIIRANRAFYAMTGLAPERARGRHVAEIIHPQGEELPCPICAAQESQQDLVLTLEADSPNNPVHRPLEVTLAVIRDSQGAPFSMLMTLHDLSHERQVQAELTAYRERLEALVQTRTAELEERNEELARLNRLFVGRELRMVELKQRLRELEEKGSGRSGNQ